MLRSHERIGGPEPFVQDVVVEVWHDVYGPWYGNEAKLTIFVKKVIRIILFLYDIIKIILMFDFVKKNVLTLLPLD